MKKSAFLIFDGVRYEVSELPSFSPELWTPVTALIEGICETYPEKSLFLLRERIYANYELTPLCSGMIKIAAKRASQVTEEEFNQLASQIKDPKSVIKLMPKGSSFSLHAPFAKLNSVYPPLEAIKLTFSLSELPKRSLRKYESDRAVGAALFDSQGKLIHYAWNTNGVNKIEHAELNLVRSYLLKNKRKIPVNSTLLVSLTPCAMCAAQIFTFADDPSKTKVAYLHEDPGPFSKNSVLIKGSQLWLEAGSPNVHMQKL